MLNGYARIIEYGTLYKDKNNKLNPTVYKSQNYIISINEGRYKNGEFSGYGRTIDNEGEC